LIGAGFASDTVVESGRDHASPYHNDFILFLAEGGVVAFGLLVAWIVWLEVTLLRRYRGYVRYGQRQRAMLVRVILVTLNGFFTAMGFNPVLPGLTRSIAVFGLAGIAMSLGDPQPRAEAERTEPVEAPAYV